MILHNLALLLVVLLAFGLVIFVHELGHFSIAKWVGIRVHEFALGFGPRLFGWRRGETEYNLRAFPFGGFVRMEGEDDPESNPNDPGSFQNKPVASQMAVVGGGVFMNYLCALLVLLLVGFLYGVPDVAPTDTTAVGVVVTGSVAEKAGLQVFDKLMAVNGQPVAHWSDVLDKIQPNPGKEITLTVQRGNEQKTFKMVPEEGTLNGKKVGRIGIAPGGGKFVFEPATSAMQVFEGAGRWLVRVTLLPFDLVSRLVHKEMSVNSARQQMGGPIAIGAMFYEIIAKGLPSILFFWAVISASVGGFNILPIPALDGARMLFLAVGAVRGRPIDPRKEGMVHMVGLMVLLAVMVLFSIQDVARLLHGIKFFSIVMLLN